MNSPITGKPMTLGKEERSLTFRKESFNVVYHFYECADSKERFTDSELDEKNMLQVHNQYRSKHNLPFPEEIISLRQKYGVSAVKMSEILGFGKNGYRNYEQGEVPSSSNGKLIQLAKDSKRFYQLIKLSEALKESERQKLLNKVENIIEHEQENVFSFEFKDYLFDGSLPDEYSGYRPPSLRKLTEMVVYFSEILNPWTTQLNKLLFYADFLMFKRSCFSISGMRYRAINMGPVVNNYRSIYEYMANNDDVDIWLHDFGGEEFASRPGRVCNWEVFTIAEQEVLEEVAKKFMAVGTKNNSTKEIIKISHEEKAWLENEKDRKIISYKTAFDLNAV